MTSAAGSAAGPPAGHRLPAELAAVVLALTGVRRGDVVLDLSPAAGLTASLAAAAGSTGSVIAHLPAHRPGDPLPPGADAVVSDPAQLDADERPSKVVLVDPDSDARALRPLLAATRGHLAPDARVTTAARAGAGAVLDGLPAVLAGCGLLLVHAEGLSLDPGGDTPSRRVALAVGRRPPGP